MTDRTANWLRRVITMNEYVEARKVIKQLFGNEAFDVDSSIIEIANQTYDSITALYNILYFNYKAHFIDGGQSSPTGIAYISFKNCDFSNVTFENTVFINVTFRHCDFYNVTFKNCSFLGVRFEMCEHTFTTIEHNNDFYFNEYQNINFAGCTLTSCFIYVNYLTFVNFSLCSLGLDCLEMDYDLLWTKHTTFRNKIDIFGKGNRDVLNKIIPMVCPETGSFIGWKKCLVETSDEELTDKPVVIKLEIPENAKRSSGSGRKCRAEYARVLEIQSLDGTPLPYDTIAYSIYDPHFTYCVGAMVTSSDFNENRFVECTDGIHFFITREEAVNY